MVNKLCLETDVESFFIIPIILLHLLIFSSRCLLKSSLLSKNNPKCFCDEPCWTWLPLKVNLGWSSEFTLRENNTLLETEIETLLSSPAKRTVEIYERLIEAKYQLISLTNFNENQDIIESIHRKSKTDVAKQKLYFKFQ